VRWWASHFGIDRAEGAITPEGKREYVATLQRDGAVVLAVGDGINDAPVLAQAQVSIAIAAARRSPRLAPMRSSLTAA